MSNAAFPVSDGFNFLIVSEDESIDLAGVRMAWGVHAKIPGAFFAGPSETSPRECFLYDDEPVNIPTEIGLREGEDGIPVTYVKATRVGTAREVALPSLASQWKADMTRRVEIAKRHGATSADFVKRAPQQFIETGVWPVDVPRP